MDARTAHHDYTTRVIRLMVWHVWHLSQSDNTVSILKALDKNVDIMRKTILYDGRHPAEGLIPLNIL